MESSLHFARYWLLVPLMLLVVWLVIIAWHDGLEGLMKRKPDDEE